MALSTTFNRLKREIGIKRCLIIDGNVGDVYLNDKKQIVDLKQYLMDMLKGMEYDDVLYWDRIDGVDGDVSKLSVIDEVEVEGDAYSFDDDEDETAEEGKTGSGLFKEPSEIFNIILKSPIEKQRLCLTGLIIFSAQAVSYLPTSENSSPYSVKQSRIRRLNISPPR